MQNKINLLIQLFLVLLLKNVEFSKSVEFYSSVHEMSRLVEIETKFVQNIQKFVRKNEDKLDFLKARLNEMERERDEAMETGAAYFDSPVNQYLLTKRLTVDWERISNLMDHHTAAEKYLKPLDEKLQRSGISFELELNGGFAGLLRLQETYRLKTKDIAAGILQKVKYNRYLNAELCYEIGLHAIELKKYRLAHSWLMEALRRLKKKSSKSKPEIIEKSEAFEAAHIKIALADAKTQLGDIRGANATYNELLELKPESQTLARAYMVFTLEHGNKKSQNIDYNDEHEPMPRHLNKATQHELYLLTCSGHIVQSPREQRDLRCGFLSETHPFLILAPIKVEELNHDPLLVMYYDVIYDSEIKVIKNLTATYQTQRATVMGWNSSVVSSVRTSQFLFLPKFEHKVLQTIDQRVQDMTNLDMNYAEDHQFQNYGIGGHYEQHHDYFHQAAMDHPERISSYELGNRIATVLFYLSDVEQGGGTAYPFIKQLLMPVKGAAAFWFNLHASGERDESTLHGGCPIIVGSKWVLNRWIRERYQDQKRPCELYP